MTDADRSRLTELLDGMDQDELKATFGELKGVLEDRGLGTVVRQIVSGTDISENQLDAAFFESDAGKALTELVNTINLRPVVYGSVDKNTKQLRISVAVELTNEAEITNAANSLRGIIGTLEENPLGQRFTAVGDRFTPELAGAVVAYQDITANKVAPNRAAVMTEFSRGRRRS